MRRVRGGWKRCCWPSTSRRRCSISARRSSAADSCSASAPARAPAVRPQLLILDEAVSNLDLLLQAEIIALLKRLQAQFDTACLFITHDLRLVERFCQRVLVMEHGRIVETATVSLPLRLRSPAGQALQQAVLPPFPATLLNEAMPCSA